MIKPPAPLGILGDGQLALMLGESALKHGLEFFAFGKDKESSVARDHPSRHLPEDMLFQLECSHILLENEFSGVPRLLQLEATGHSLIPRAQDFVYFAHKIAQRAFYAGLKIPSPKWTAINSDALEKQIFSALKLAETEHSYPFVVKKSQGGYDGYGVRVVRNHLEFTNALSQFGFDQGADVLLEECVQISHEFAQGALFDGNGNYNLLPLVETVQRNGICECVISRLNLSVEILREIQAKAITIFRKIANSGIKGLFNFEFFLTKDLRILINEGAPRPHNSQHLTLNAAPISQFDMLVYFAKNGSLPLPTESIVPCKPAVMVNLLGQRDSDAYSLTLPSYPAEIGVHTKLYQKKTSRVGRKMGHVVLVDESGTFNLSELAEHTLREYNL